MTQVNNSGAVPLGGGTMTGALILSGDPVNALGAVTKQYADAISAGFNVKTPCRLGTTGALTVTYNNGVSGVGATLTNAGVQAALTLDGVAAAVNDRVLVKNQASTLQNGIYVVTDIGSGASNWVMTRAADYNTAAEIYPGDFILVTAGTQANSGWIQTADPAVIGTDAISFTQFSAGAGAPTDATYITQTPNGSLTNEQALSALATGLLKNTTGTGVLTIGVQGTDFYAPGGTDVAVTDGGTGRSTSTTAFGTICAGTTATGALQTVAPGTAGQTLISAGAAALPAYGTLGVNGGGTGRTTSTTAFGTICAGTTATGALQTVAPGTAGQTLISAGAAALPAYGTLGVTGGGTGLATATTAYGVVCAGTTATGAFQVLNSLGTAGQVLTSNGAGLLPSFQSNPAGSGSMVFIAAATAAGSASIDFTAGITSTYDQYVVNFTDVIPATNAVNFWVRLQSGGVFRNTASDYAWSQIWYTTAASGQNSSADTEIELCSSGRPLSNTSTKGASGNLHLGNPANTATHKRVWGTYTYWETLVVSGSFGGWLVGVTTAVTGIQFLMSSGNITSGTFQLYGIRKS